MEYIVNINKSNLKLYCYSRDYGIIVMHTYLLRELEQFQT